MINIISLCTDLNLSATHVLLLLLTTVLATLSVVIAMQRTWGIDDISALSFVRSLGLFAKGHSYRGDRSQMWHRCLSASRSTFLIFVSARKSSPSEVPTQG